MNSGEACVARGRCIPALLFQRLKKSQDRVAAEIVEAQIDDCTTATLGGEGEEAADGVPIGVYSVWAHAAGSNQVPSKEGLD
jgi:uncharacterized protein with beta-barrel porin domain